MNDREELKALADREAAARRRYNETDKALIRESKLIEGALRLASQPSADVVRMREALRLAEGRLTLLMDAALPESDHPTATAYVLEQVKAAIDAIVPADGEKPLEDNRWITEAKATLEKLGSFLQKTGAPHRVDWQEWIDNADKHLGLKWPSEATPAPAFGCKRAGGFVDSSCCAPCDCDKTMRLTQPDPADDAAVAEWQSRFKTSWGWTKWYNIDLPIDVFRRIRRGTISTGAMEIRPLYTHPAKAVDTLTPDELQSLTSLADGMGFGRTHDALRKLLAALLNAGPGQTGGK